MTATERRRLIETPIRLNVIPPRTWAGRIAHKNIPVDGQRIRPFHVYQSGDERASRPEDLSYWERD